MRIKIFGHKRTVGDIVFDYAVYLVLLLLSIAILYPFLNVIALSLNDARDSLKGGIYVWPRIWTLNNYQCVLRDSDIYRAMGISTARTVIGTTLSVIFTMLLAYPLSRQEFILRKFLSRLTVFTLYFSGGIIPIYFLYKNLGLTNHFLVYIMPALIHGFNVIIAKSYIQSLPGCFVEAAKIDGAGEFRTLISVILPLCMPIIATIALFVAVWHWNSWFDTMLYASSNPKLSTLQYELQKMLQSVQSAMGSQNADFSRGSSGTGGNITPAALRATMTVVAIAPITVVYPLAQKYFIHGITLGGVKG